MTNLLNTLRHTKETAMYSKMGVIQHSYHGNRIEFQIRQHSFKMHQIVELLTGNDGLTRAATLRTSSDVTDEQRSHYIKVHSEALFIRSSTDVFFLAGSMLRRRRQPYFARATTSHTRCQRRRYVTAGNGRADAKSKITCIHCRINIE